MKFSKSEYDSVFFKKIVWNLSINKNLNKTQLNNILKMIKEEKIDLIFCVTNLNYYTIESLKRLDFKLISIRNVYSSDLNSSKKLQNKKSDLNITQNLPKINEKDISIFANSLIKNSRFYKDPLLKHFSYDYYKKWLVNSISNNKNRNFYAIYDNKISGLLLLKFNRGIPRIELISVKPKYQYLGIGSLLINKAKNSLAKDNKNKLIAGTQADNLKAIRFYEKNGFRTVGTDLIYHKHIIK